MPFSSNYFVSSVLESSCTRMYTAVGVNARKTRLRAVLPRTCSKMSIFRDTFNKNGAQQNIVKAAIELSKISI